MNTSSNLNSIFESDDYKKILLMYSSAIKELDTKLNILNTEFNLMHNYNPIEHIKSRIKKPENIIKKLEKKNLEVNYNNIIEHIDDIAGVRIVCSFIPDVYEIINIISTFENIEILEEKDYISNQKDSGYSSYHLILSVPVVLSHNTAYVKVELQIRTVAMDFWATLEHKINYKFPDEVPDEVKTDLKECAMIINSLDNKMLSLNTSVKSLSPSLNKLL